MEEAIRLIKEFSKGSARDNINVYLEVTDNPTVERLFKNLKQVFSSGEDGQQMLAEFYSHILGPHVKPRSITVNQIDTSDVESPPKKRKCDSKLDKKINAALEENQKLSECLSTVDPKTIVDTVINAVQSNTQANKPHSFGPKPYKPSQFYGKPKEPELVPSTDGLLKPDTDCNYCKDLSHTKFNYPKLKAKEARMARQQNYHR